MIESDTDAEAVGSSSERDTLSASYENTSVETNWTGPVWTPTQARLKAALTDLSFAGAEIKEGKNIHFISSLLLIQK